MENLFDPMTGKRLKREEEEMLFDPMTGERLKREEEEMLFDPMTGRPIGKRKNSIWKKKMSSKIAMVFIVAVVIGLFGIKSGIFYGKSTKVLLAIKNTVEDQSEFGEALRGLEMLKSNSYTMDMNLRTDDITFEGTYSSKKSKKQLNGKIQGEGMDKQQEFNTILTKDQLQVQIPTIDDIIYFYNYKENNTGYLVKELGTSSIDGINQLLKMLGSNKEQRKTSKDLRGVFLDHYKKLEFESVDKEKFEVNGKDRNCKGYRTTYTKYDYLELVRELESYMRDNYANLGNIGDFSYSDIFDELASQGNHMIDKEITFYLYKNKLACIRIENEVGGKEREILFLGGETRTQNIKVTYNGDVIMELYGKTSGSKERGNLTVDGSGWINWSYDTKEGDFIITQGDDYGEGTIEGSIKSKWRSMTCKIDNITYSYDDDYYDYEDINFSASIIIKKGAKIQKIEGRGFDVGNASEDELRVIKEKLDENSPLLLSLIR